MKKAVLLTIGMILEAGGLFYLIISNHETEKRINFIINKQAEIKAQLNKNTAEEYRDALIFLYKKAGNTRRKILGVNDIGMDSVMQNIPVKDVIEKVTDYKNQ